MAKSEEAGVILNAIQHGIVKGGMPLTVLRMEILLSNLSTAAAFPAEC